MQVFNETMYKECSRYIEGYIMSDRYQSLKDHVYEYIASQIDNGEVKAGDRISEKDICDVMGVSRTPVREALIQLAGDGYLDNLPRRGFRVRGFDQQAACEVFQIIGPVDGQAAMLACRNLTPDDFSQMHFLVDSMDMAIQCDLFKKYDDMQREFHDSYINKCENNRLVALVRQMYRHLIMREYHSVDRETNRKLLHRANEEHRHILELLEEGKAEEVRDYIRDVHWNTDNAPFTTW